jgi:hypothetical protein
MPINVSDDMFNVRINGLCEFPALSITLGRDATLSRSDTRQRCKPKILQESGFVEAFPNCSSFDS